MFNIFSKSPLYDQNSVQPYRDELIAVGFTELLTPNSVDEALSQNEDKISLVFMNSVCGCAAGSARPGVSLALQNQKIPDNLYTVFAGQEREAVEMVRSKYIKNFPPSSPCISIFKNGELVYFMQRMDIEGNTAESIANDLKQVFDKICTKEGPSITPEQFEQISYAKQCGSKIPLFNN